MEINLVSESLKFMILGMGIVFAFLYVMILILQLQAKIIGKYFPDKPMPKDAKIVSKSPDNKAKKVAAAIAAIAHHKKMGN